MNDFVIYSGCRWCWALTHAERETVALRLDSAQYSQLTVSVVCACISSKASCIIYR